MLCLEKQVHNFLVPVATSKKSISGKHPSRHIIQHETSNTIQHHPTRSDPTSSNAKRSNTIQREASNTIERHPTSSNAKRSNIIQLSNSAASNGEASNTMRLHLQRVSEASVTIAGQVQGTIGTGVVALLGIREGDTTAEANWLVDKLVRLRIFPDDEGRMNRSLQEVAGGVLLISQFTLYGACEKGNRPSFIAAARPETARPLYDYFRARLTEVLGQAPACGVFGADMKVALVNDGPVTLLLERDPQS